MRGQPNIDFQPVIGVIELVNPDRHWKGADRGQRGPHPLDLALAPRDDEADQSLARSLEEALFDRLQHHEYGQNQQRREKGDDVLRSPGRHADRGDCPDGRGGRQPTDQVANIKVKVGITKLMDALFAVEETLFSERNGISIEPEVETFDPGLVTAA